MARPREFDEDRVIEAAMGQFWANGYARTSLSDLYEATGLRPSSLYAAFKDKETLFRLVFERYAKHFESTLPKSVDGLPAIRAWLATLVRIASEDPKRRGCLIVNTLFERDTHPPSTRAIAQARLDDIRRYFVRQLTLARKRGELDAILDVQAAADGLVGAVIGILTLGRAETPAARLQHVADAAIAALPLVDAPRKTRRN